MESDEAGAMMGALVYITDVTERQNAEEAMRLAQTVAETANEAKSEFLARMSHELRTPLNAVLGFGQLLHMQALTPGQHEAVGLILTGGRHLLSLVNEVLDIARIESGALNISAEAVQISELVEESLDLVRTLAEERDIAFVVDDDGFALYILADRQRARQVLLNLLSNAVKYSHVGGTVAISCLESGSTRLRLLVADNGPGIRAELMSRLFAPFDRLDAGGTDVEGTGLGLSLSKGLIEAMGGTLDVESTPGRGSTFSIDFQRVDGPVERYEREPEPVRVSSRIAGTGPDVGRGTVLYIDDNASNLRLMDRILAQRADTELVLAKDGALGLDLARRCEPTVILLDLHLPDIGGEEILRRLRSDPVTSSVPVVMITADATSGQVRRLLDAGANAYLTKPLDIEALLRVLDEIMYADDRRS